MSSSKPSFGVPPVERAIHLLHFIGDGNSCSNTSQAAKLTGINRTTMLRLLETLQDQRMIEPDGNNGYVLGTGLIHLANKALNSRDVVSVSQPVLSKLASVLGLSAHLGILEGVDVLYLLRETPNLHLVSNVRVGSRLPVHATSIGRIILAHLEKNELTQLLGDIELFKVTPKTPTSKKQLIALLEADKESGVAWSEGNFEAAIGSAAVALFDATGAVIAAINVTGPVGEFGAAANRRDEIKRAVLQAAEKISTQLGYLPGGRKHKLKPGVHNG